LARRGSRAAAWNALTIKNNTAIDANRVRDFMCVSLSFK
jgi:hypothetical protein